MGEVLPLPARPAPALPQHLPPVQGTLALAWSPLPEPPSAPVLPLPAAWTAVAARLLQALVDVESGTRPAHQVLQWTSPGVYRHLLRVEQRRRSIAGAAAAGRRAQARVTSVRVCPVGDDVAEISAVVLRQDRAGQRRASAVAARMESRDGQWRATAFEF